MKKIRSIFLLGLILSFSTAAFAGERLTDIVFVIVLDGTRQANAYSTAGEPKTYLTQLIQEGVAYRGRANYPSNTLTNFVSIATGSTPGKHSVSSGFTFFDPKTFEKITFGKEHVAVPSVFEVLEKNGMRGIFINAKGYDSTGVGAKAQHAVVLDGKKLNKEDPKISEGNKYDPLLNDPKYKGKFTYGWNDEASVATTPETMAFANKIRMTQTLARAGLKTVEEAIQENDNVGLVITNFHTADLTGHTWGPNHPFYDQAIAEMSRGVEFYIGEIKKRLPNKRLTFIITADHGFKGAESMKSLGFKEDKPSEILDQLFGDIEYGVGDCGSACASFFIKDRTNYLAAFDKLYAEKIKPDGWVDKIYTYLNYRKADGKLQDLKAYYPGRSAQFMIDLKPNWSLTHVYGHGTNGDDDRDIPMILSGAGIKKVGKVVDNQIVSTAIAPTALNLLGIKAPKEWDGKVISAALTK